MDEATPDLRTVVARHLAEQTDSARTADRWMKRLEMASLGLAAGLIVVAIAVSASGARVQETTILAAWFAFVASVFLCVVLVGLHAVALRAFPPVALPGKVQTFVTGQRAVWSGWGLVVIAVIGAAFWGGFFYAIWTVNMDLIQVYIRIITAVVGVGATIAVVQSLYQQASKAGSANQK